MTPKEYVESGKHLPPPMRDFHDLKDLFKLMHRTYGDKTEGKFVDHSDEINWRVGCCYVVDWFLWFMAQRGWTLQRSRSDVQFYDLESEIAQMKSVDSEAFRNALEARAQQNAPQAPADVRQTQ